MKNLIVGIAMVILLTFFISFQVDVNAMQVQGIRLRNTANEAARSAALKLDSDIFSEGFIVFNGSDSIRASRELLTQNLKLNGTKSELKYFKDTNITYYICMFNQTANTPDEQELVPALGKYYIYKNGSDSPIHTGTYQKGHRASEYINTYIRLPKNFDPILDNPSVVCIVDTGHPKISVGELSSTVILRKAGIYEYALGG